MAFNGYEGEVVSLQEAASWTEAFREAHPKSIKAFFVGKHRLDSILTQTGCVGVRAYNGIHPQDGPCLIWVGVDANGRDLTGGIVIERNPPCPPYCDDQSVLNG